MDELLEIMRRLRDPERGCPWDLRQRFDTIVPYTLEEAAEVADVVERQAWGELRGELGDLLFQVVFLSRLAEERGWFDFADVARAIVDKMRRRHPHVFGDARFTTEEALKKHWESAKAEEHSESGHVRKSLMDGVPLTLPALARAQKLQSRAARTGLLEDNKNSQLTELHEILSEVGLADSPEQREEGIGQLLFDAVSLARALGIDAEQALRGASRRFEGRVRAVEQAQNHHAGALSEQEVDASQH